MDDECGAGHCCHGRCLCPHGVFGPTCLYDAGCAHWDARGGGPWNDSVCSTRWGDELLASVGPANSTTAVRRLQAVPLDAGLRRLQAEPFDGGFFAYPTGGQAAAGETGQAVLCECARTGDVAITVHERWLPSTNFDGSVWACLLELARIATAPSTTRWPVLRMPQPALEPQPLACAVRCAPQSLVPLLARITATHVLLHPLHLRWLSNHGPVAPADGSGSRVHIARGGRLRARCGGSRAVARLLLRPPPPVRSHPARVVHARHAILVRPPIPLPPARWPPAAATAARRRRPRRVHAAAGGSDDLHRSCCLR